MPEDTEQTTSGGGYPYSQFQTCLAVGEAVHKLGGAKSGVSKSLIAQTMNEDEKGQSLAFKLTSTKTYGIIEGRSLFMLTEAGKRYFLPTSATDRERAMLEFFSSPPAFRILIRRFDGSQLPAPEMLANILQKEAGVSPSWKDRIASYFMRTAHTVSALDNGGFLRVRASMDRLLAGHTPMRNNASVTTQIQETVAVPNSRPIASDLASDIWSYRELRVETPKALSLELWKKLKGYVELLKPDDGEEG
jgi:hypothetical protein